MAGTLDFGLSFTLDIDHFIHPHRITIRTGLLSLLTIMSQLGDQQRSTDGAIHRYYTRLRVFSSRYYVAHLAIFVSHAHHAVSPGDRSLTLVLHVPNA
jgi:hypothetical protein